MPKFNGLSRKFFLYFILYSEASFLSLFTLFVFILRRTSYIIPYSSKVSLILIVFNLFVALQMLTVCTDVDSKSLKTRGVYALCRHPFLFFRFCSQASLLFLLNNNLLRFILFVFYFVLTLFRINRHELSLARRYKDEWKRYCDDTFKITPLPLNFKRLFQFNFKIQPFKIASIVKFWVYVTFVLTLVSCFRFI